MINVFPFCCCCSSIATRYNKSISKAINCVYSPVSVSLSLSILSASYSSPESGLGLVDQLLNSRQVRDAPNILILHVTSFPFALQTQYTRISPYNEIHWPSTFSNVRFNSVCDTHCASSVKYCALVEHTSHNLLLNHLNVCLPISLCVCVCRMWTCIMRGQGTLVCQSF